MPPKQFWLNLPVKDVEASKAFYLALKFPLNDKYGNSDISASFKIGESYIVMLFQEEKFKGFTKFPLSDTKQGSEVLISIDADNREEVDALAVAAEAAGGEVFCKPSEIDGWMYGCGFTDLDGHRWNALHMDFSKLPQQKPECCQNL